MTGSKSDAYKGWATTGSVCNSIFK